MGKQHETVLVKCNKSACGAQGFCGHATPHVERENCYNNRPDERTSKDLKYPRIVCPACAAKG